MNNSPQQIHQFHLAPCNSSNTDLNIHNGRLTDPNEEMLQMTSTSRSLQQYHFGGGFYDITYPTPFESPLPLPPRPPRSGHSTLLDPNESINLSSYFDRLSGVTDAGAIFDAKLASNFNFHWPEDPASPNFPDYMSMSENSYLSNDLINGGIIESSFLSGNVGRTMSNGGSLESDLGGGTSSNSSATPQPITINPFENHGLVSHSGNSGNAMTNEMLLSGLPWGSDPHFATSGYRAPLQMTTNDDVREKVFSILQKNESTDSTAVNSPVEIKFEAIGRRISNGSNKGFDTASLTSSPSPSITATQSIGIKRKAEGNFSERTSRKVGKKADSESDNSTPKRRKKSGGKREHLTEEEKRANHIQSEQKRRNIIRQGFEDLCLLVPDLRSGGFSKSAVLTHAANYLVETKKGNERLKAIIRQLEAGQRIS